MFVSGLKGIQFWERQEKAMFEVLSIEETVAIIFCH